MHRSGRFRGLKSPLPRTEVRGWHQPFSLGLSLSGWLKVSLLRPGSLAEKQFVRNTQWQGAKARHTCNLYARLKSCPDTKQSFSAARKVVP
jgi:hypothetical protein